MTGPYDDPALYDALTTPGTAAEVDGLERIARRFLHRDSVLRWLEPACGTGRYLRVLAARRHHAAGFDRSAAMVAYAQARLRRLGFARRARVFVADMTRFTAHLGGARFDVAFNLANTIRHLESDAALRAHLREVARALAPGGIYVIGASLTRYGEDLPEEDVWEARRGRLAVRQLVQYLPPCTSPRGVAPRASPSRIEPERTEWVVSHVAILRPSGTVHHDVVYPLRCYDESQWRRLLQRSPFRHAGTVTWNGEPIGTRATPYALDVLQRPSR